MYKGLCGIAVLTGLFVSVFVGALAYKLVKRTGIDEVTESEGYQSEPQSFGEGRASTGQPLPEGA